MARNTLERMEFPSGNGIDIESRELDTENNVVLYNLTEHGGDGTAIAATGENGTAVSPWLQELEEEEVAA